VAERSEHLTVGAPVAPNIVQVARSVLVGPQVGRPGEPVAQPVTALHITTCVFVYLYFKKCANSSSMGQNDKILQVDIAARSLFGRHCEQIVKYLGLCVRCGI